MAQAKPKDIAIQPTSVPSLLRILTLVTVIGVVVALVFALNIAGTDIEQGEVQRIFYVHMPAFFGAFLAFGATVLGGVMYLWKRDPKWDRLAVAGVEVGFAFAMINLITGSIWARPIWNTWWTWDPRLTSEAIMILTYAAYMMLRAGIDNMDTRRRFASVYGILAFATVLLTLFIIRFREDTIHPTVVGNSPQNAQGTFAATSGVVTALMVGLLIWGLLAPVTLIWYRIRLENMLDWVNRKKMEVLSA